MVVGGAVVDAHVFHPLTLDPNLTITAAYIGKFILFVAWNIVSCGMIAVSFNTRLLSPSQ